MLQGRERDRVHIVSAPDTVSQRSNIPYSKGNFSRQFSPYLGADILDHRRTVIVPVDKPDTPPIVESRIENRKLWKTKREAIVPVERWGHTVVQTCRRARNGEAVRRYLGR